MDLGLDFDDSFFTEKVRQKQTLTSYNAKVCYPEWFLSDLADNGRNDMATVYKFRGDNHYQRKNLESAIECYKNSLDNLGIHNRTMRRELMESLARCYMLIGQFEVSHQYTECVMNDCLTVDHFGQFLLLQQQLYRCSGDLLKEVSALHQLISIHPDNAHFWLKLSEAYEKIRRNTVCTSTYTKADATESRKSHQHLQETCIDPCTVRCTDKKSHEFPECLQGSDGVKKCLCSSQNVNLDSNVGSKECSSPAGCHGEVREQTTTCTGHFRELLSGYPVDMILLTCYTRTRLKLLSVQGTVGSFIKDKNKQLVEMLDKKIEDLSVPASVLDLVTQFVGRDMVEDDDDEESSSDQSQDIKAIMENRVTAEDFNNRWFSWIKEFPR